MVSVKRTMSNYFLVQFLKANCNPYMFTTYLLQDFREYFDKLHSKAQLKIVNDYLSIYLEEVEIENQNPKLKVLLEDLKRFFMKL